MMTRSGKILSIIIVTLIAAALVHHAIKHEGSPFQNYDFEDTVKYLIKSHEAIILVLLVFLGGVITNDLRIGKKNAK